ncbi:hypothetical protein D083_2399 [Dickeya solani RNS 08.23.3.1.A]|nr:hypothetical protein D083_2399 [Dickeya solani RNS 08.23.3.1.A]
MRGDNYCLMLFLWCCLLFFCYFADFITNKVVIYANFIP